jgi:hypothetical protein
VWLQGSNTAEVLLLLLLLGGVFHQLNITDTRHEKARSTANMRADNHQRLFR